jgi:hypothetical protein
MNNTFVLIALSIALFLLSSCSVFYTGHSTPDSVASPKPLAVPVGKNWQIIEEAPKLSDDKGRPPFQTEQSVQPEGAKPVQPEDNRTIKTPQ